MPTRLAARKWPSAWTKTRTPRTNAKDTSVVSNDPSDLQFYPACKLQRMLPGLPIDGPNFGKGRHLDGAVRFHRALDHLRDGGKPEAPFEKPGDGHFVGRVQDDRKASLRLEGPICKAQARKRLGVGHGELQPAGARQIE